MVDGAEVRGIGFSTRPGLISDLSEKDAVPQWSVAIPLHKELYGGGGGLWVSQLHVSHTRGLFSAPSRISTYSLSPRSYGRFFHILAQYGSSLSIKYHNTFTKFVIF